MKKMRKFLIFCLSAVLLFGCSVEKYYNQWVKKGNYYYYYGSDGGMMAKGWLQVGEDWYCLEKDGKMMVNSWIKSNDKVYYVGTDGKMLTNCEKEIDGVIYIFDTEGSGKEKPEANVVIQGLNTYMRANNYVISIDNYTYDIEKSYGDEYRIIFDFECTVLKKGKYRDGSIYINYKLIDANGYTIEDGIFGPGGCLKERGEKFKYRSSISGLKKGDNIIKFSEEIQDYGIYYR